jgi:hypothetical protein
MRILGVDPGVHGGMAIVETIDGMAPQLIAAIDIPTVGIRPKNELIRSPSATGS